MPQRRRATSTGSAPAPLLIHGTDDVQRPGLFNQLVMIVDICAFSMRTRRELSIGHSCGFDIYLLHSMTVLKHPTWDTQGGVGMNSCINLVLYEVRVNPR